MSKFDLFKKKSFAIDLVNNNTLVCDEHRLLVDQPSYIALDASNTSVKAVGKSAYNMFEKSHDDIKPVKPLKGGVIADFHSASKMISALMAQAYGHRSLLNSYDQIISGVPFGTTQVERGALIDALNDLHAKKVYLIYEPLAAALGMGLNIREPNGKMIVDIGGGITEIVIISLSGIASFQSLKIAGDSMDEDIQHYFRKQYNMAIGIKTAEQIKIGAGAVISSLSMPTELLNVKGKDVITGLPVTRSIGHSEIAHVLEKSIAVIELAIIQTLEGCPPELSSDIYENGIHITGGNALLRGLGDRLQEKLRVPVHIDMNALFSVSQGVAKVLKDTKSYRGMLIQ